MVLGLQDPEKFKSQMHSLAYGSAMMAAAKDYQKVPQSLCMALRQANSTSPQAHGGFASPRLLLAGDDGRRAGQPAGI